MIFDTIVALATPPIKSALAIVRLSGDDSLKVASKVFSFDLEKVAGPGHYFGTISHQGHLIDEAVALVFLKPHSFTGEHCVEFNIHGSPLIAQQVIEACLANGARLATNGEFSSRAHLNGRLDLVQAEAINDVINATTSESKRLALLSLSGESSALIIPIKTAIADILSIIEVNIDYPEYEDLEPIDRDKTITKIRAIRASIQNLVLQGKQGRIIKEGLNLAIVGKPNVGKSSLLNAMLKEDKAIVTDIAGTTRDVVEGDINLAGLVLHLSDTAGIREGLDAIEKMGIAKSRKAIEKADLVIVVLDASKALETEDEKILEMTKDSKRIIVYNKSDLKPIKDDGKLYISALTKDIKGLETAILDLFGIEEESYLRPSLNNARQIGLLQNIDRSLEAALTDAENGLSFDLISASLQDAYQDILKILGLETSTDLAKEIFSRFCVGK
ncbi:MAG TPA: tRNA uridine-5-carboxymethylaminomethyl(34) synthesis GTPase MnmE [Bacilli bacterium]|nr:tRNA uridine-5-carboxymethylaminomethyl(34) synthesis GTPase MnmE [Bacilli bacterium]